MSHSNSPLQTAILQTLAYSDIFDYPLTIAEIHRYLIGVPANLETIHEHLTNGLRTSNLVTQSGDYFTLPGREGLTETRAWRATQSARLWPQALHYGKLLAGFPFVRMVALTGTLAVNNVENGADVDYFIVTKPERLWLCRAFVIALVHIAARSRITLCPNFFLAENALTLPDQTLYTAHEITQMIPLSGMEVYQRIRCANPWVYLHLPNASGPPPVEIFSIPGKNPLKSVLEPLFNTPVGSALEKWEMSRKIRKFTSQASNTKETRFSPDRCQGHFDGYGKKTMDAFELRLEKVNHNL